jgi:protein TonB
VPGPRKVKNVDPIYPAGAMASGTPASVILEAIIAKDGRVRDERVVRSPGPEFDKAAIAAVRQWKYAPTRLNGEPVELLMTVTVTFTTRWPSSPPAQGTAISRRLASEAVSL